MALDFIKRALAPTVQRQEESEESEDIFQAAIDEFWGGLRGVGFSPRLIDRVWVVNRCIGLNAQQIARMPLRFTGTTEPAWVANPDPVWFPNGIGDAVYAAIDSMYRWGDAFLYITARYSNEYPSAWTLLNAETMGVDVERGRKTYRSGQVQLNPDNVVQISRDPRGGLKGTSLIKSYASQAYGLLAASDLGRVMMDTGGTPNAVIKSKKKLNEAQALSVQNKWVARTGSRRGAPAVLGPDYDFEMLAFSPQDLMLLDVQKFDAQVLASAAGVPALFLNLPIEGGLNYQSPAMLGEHWWRFELRTMAMTFSQAVSAQMLPRGNVVQFDATDTLAPTTTELVDSVVKLIEKGIITIEEARVLLKLPPGQAAEALEELMIQPSAGASPAQQSGGVIELRPASTGQ